MRFTLLFICLGLWSPAFAAEPTLSVSSSESSIAVQIGSVEVLQYVHQDPTVSQPYFAPVRTVSGLQVSRNHPPVSGEDKTDHPSLHTGIWMSFGDLSGHDYWRMRAKTVHRRFADPPTVTGKAATWCVVNHYLAADSEKAICEETARYRVSLRPEGYQLEITSEFRPLIDEIIFGD